MVESEEFEMGRTAYLRGESLEFNPYVADDTWDRGSYEDWARGWRCAKREAEAGIPANHRDYDR